jgi:hypothetical protein
VTGHPTMPDGLIHGPEPPNAFYRKPLDTWGEGYLSVDILLIPGWMG